MTKKNSFTEKLKKARTSGEELGLSTEELVFYDALLSKREVADIKDDNVLIEMARTLTTRVHKSATLDWQNHPDTLAQMRLSIKRVLKRMYPKEELDSVIDFMLEQVKKRDSHSELMFLVQKEFPENVLVDTIILVPLLLDDSGYKTRFTLYYGAAGGQFKRIGQVAILCENHTICPDDFCTAKELPLKFEQLDPNKFCSLGQESYYYSRLGTVPDIGLEIFKKLNDICFSEKQSWWDVKQGFFQSLIRYNNSYILYNNGKDIFEGFNVDEEESKQIIYSSETQFPEEIIFNFNSNLEISGRINVIVGKNGSGKTTLLYALAESLSEEHFYDDAKVPAFSSVILASYNLFEEGKYLPGNNQVRLIGNVIIGSQYIKHLNSFSKLDFSKKEVRDDLCDDVQSLKEIQKALQTRNSWKIKPQDLEALQFDEDWVEFISDALDNDELSSKIINYPSIALYTMSPGQTILVSLYASLFILMDTKSIVLIDEPENYLHPSLSARFVRKFNQLLEIRKSFAIISTHDPVVIQETPAKFVHILSKHDNKNYISNPTYETFGESIDNICDKMFETDFKSSYWKSVLREFSEKSYTLKEVESKISNLKLPLLASSYYGFLSALKSN